MRAGASRSLNFDYQNRQLVLSELSDFAVYVLPMLRVYSAMRSARRYAARGKARLQRLGRHMGWMNDSSSTVTVPNDQAEGSEESNHGVAMPATVEACSWCDTTPAQMPYIVSCGCTLCYYCLRTRVDPVPMKAADREDEHGLRAAVTAACPSCGQHIRWSRRWEDFYRQARPAYQSSAET